MKAMLDELLCSVELLEGDTAILDVINKHISDQTQAQKSAFFVADLGAILWQQVRWKSHMDQVRPFYDVKCNSSAVVVEILAALGTGFVCSNKHQLELVKNFGVPAQDVILGGACKQLSLIKYAAKNGVQLLVCDNEAEMRKIARCHPNAKLLLQVYTACCCEHGETAMPFGCTLKDCRHLLECAKELGINITGVKFHIPSCCADPEAFTHAVSDARCVFDMGAELGFSMSILDIGGGFDGVEAQLEKVNRALKPMLDAYFPQSTGVSVIAEPGAYYVSAAFSLAVSVISKKMAAQNANHHAQNALSGNNEPEFTYCLNDTVFGSFAYKLLEESDPVPSLLKEMSAEEPLFTSSLCGSSNDGLDQVLESCLLPELSVGDWLVFNHTGANSLAVMGEPPPPVHFIISAQDWYEIQNYGIILDTALKNFSLVPCFQKPSLSESAISTPA
ncbi:antizyme inhibitor 1a [Tachysurus fulvidraco]|uniref:antizyme inhibitor 1a n=1 Tax=Tachysurus fulvidraco TaxID=1234273 RepID=UPI001FF008B9|nr:antizyme inhibitor 1a [Tachysurus fulvidraco]XP_047664587.1 antizyme inhibitor 1a [Tachysurus fulvidraco]XP_047664588.1 antizyme inhibitor 1a [Tachysurus fulvidraco]XP_047664589.1 antizyme inhibitor 1a [Tachysurus fulvidraco]